MAILNLNFESRFLNSNHAVSVILPNVPHNCEPADFFANEKKYKVLWLLHGTFGDHSDWLRFSNIELYACEKDLIVVMPSALNSNYSNWSTMMGFDMYDYILKELMPLVWNWFPASSKREDNFIAGLSMGGRGTVKFAANHPELFAAAAILSATPERYDDLCEDDLINHRVSDRLKGMIDNAGGLEAFQNGTENAWRLLDEKVGTGTLPRLLFACGTEDTRVYNGLQKFQPHAEEIGLDAEFWYADGYAHEWRFWDLAIQYALKFFGL